MVVAPTITMNNGLKMPAFGLGTYASVNREGIQSIKEAIDAGYRHFDTAYMYGTESEVGTAIKEKIAEGVIKREDVFVVTKLWCTFHDPSRVERIFRKSLENLGLDYIDLYLIHFPVGFAYQNDETLFPTNAEGGREISDVDYLDTWKAVEKLVKTGLVRSIGVSNFNSEQIDRILANCEIKPVTNQVIESVLGGPMKMLLSLKLYKQIECSPTINQKKLIKFCKDRDIIITAYSPLGQAKPDLKKPDYLFNDKVKEIGDKYNKTAAQVILRYLTSLGTVPIPKSATKSRIYENINIFDFQLTDEESAFLDSFNTGARIISLPDTNHSKYWPFAIEY